MVLSRHHSHRFQAGAASEKPRAPVRMEPDLLPVATTGLWSRPPDVGRHGDHAEIVHECGAHQVGGLRGVEVGDLGGDGHDAGDPPGVPGPLGQLQVRVITERPERTEQNLTRDAHPGRRFQGQHHPPEVVRTFSEVLRADLQRGVDHLGVVSLASPAHHDLPCCLVARLACPQLQIAGDDRHPHRHRDVRAGDTGRDAATIPPGVRESEGGRDPLRQPHLQCQASPHLTMCFEQPLAASRVGQGARQGAKPLRQPLTGRDQTDHRSDLLAWRAHRYGSHAGQEPDLVTAGHRSKLVCVGGAAQEPQQRDVVDLAAHVGW